MASGERRNGRNQTYWASGKGPGTVGPGVVGTVPLSPTTQEDSAAAQRGLRSQARPRLGPGPAS